MNKYLEEAMKNNTAKYLPETFEDYCKLHPSQTRSIPISHIKKLRDAYTGQAEEKKDSFVNKKIDWDN